jgi:uncharacterized RDD family membrane protein YckC
MKLVEITTAQNVTIEYKAASVFERILAWIIDFGIILVSLLISRLLIKALVPYGISDIVSVILLVPIYFLYHLLFEIFNNGASIGKKTLGLRVIKITREPVSVYDYFMRWAFRLIDIGPVGTVAIITISSSPYNQRIGDYLADTTVVKILKSERVSLNRISQLENLKNYEPVYPEVLVFNETDMLVFKEVIERVNKYPGITSDKILAASISKAESLMGLTLKNRNVDFLRTLIKDYVALTR